MVTITQTIQWYIRQQARKIYSLKETAVTRQTGEKYAYVSPDRTRTQDQRPTPQEIADGWKLEKVSYEKITGHMSPRHADWPMYQAARHEASLLLTARRLLKIGSGALPERSAVRAAVREGALRQHAKRGQARRLANQAYHYLHKLMNRLERAPERFQAVEEWQKSLQTAAALHDSKEEAHAR